MNHNPSIAEWTLSLAPMMDWTDRHFRYFFRLLSKKTYLYTEMVTTGAILKSANPSRFLEYDKIEHPIALQLGGDDPNLLAEAAIIGESFGYDEINLNVGCPSDRVQSGAFGACLMKEPKLVAKMVSMVKTKVKVPVTVKHRIGIDGRESFDDLFEFVREIKEAGVDRIIVHARIAILKGLSPALNRTVPPLRYDDVYKLKDYFPELPIVINGGILNFDSAKFHLKYVDGVMIGRAAYENPYQFLNADCDFYGEIPSSLPREEILLQLIPYLESEMERGTKAHHILKHILGLYQGVDGAREYRRYFSDPKHFQQSAKDIIYTFLSLREERKLSVAK
ncbi:tRNA-dihydrouridine synthase [Leptospira ryugenii]|uniref:tRNA-dihydrouridine(20/20a) synthase n=1 Tax=Leptospira ryugenii TaxID=1917863 RepID=A0A2P2E195_9LEPT|nr:tRNA dihydrouridine(20/20a) synthase DusA [Leptospira ryugenii]GBF50658.1 tRNA-dihydrouridine synthase [Leptospira ryugenii]